jgi:hypothetical protein
VYYTSPITQVIAPGQGTVTSESFGTITNFTTTGNTVLGDASTDTLNVGNGGLVKDASGNVGIGTSTLVGYRVAVKQSSNTGLGSVGIASISSTNDTLVGMGYSSATDTCRILSSFDSTGAFKPLTFLTSDAERMRINSSGNVGIGTTNPVRSLVVSNNGAEGLEIGPGDKHGDASGSVSAIYYNRATSAYIQNIQDASLYIWRTSGTERMRIGSGGDVAIGKALASETPSTGSWFGFASAAADPFFSSVNANASGANANIYLSKRTTGTIVAIFTNNGTTNTSVGSISTAASSTAFNTSSDYRLKHDIAPMTGALSRVATLKPVTYKWNVDNSDGEGFIAHELAEVCPQAVNGKKDAVNEDGSINPQGIDTSFLVATLTAAIQEQQAIIQTLTDRITALEGAK